MTSSVSLLFSIFSWLSSRSASLTSDDDLQDETAAFVSSAGPALTTFSLHSGCGETVVGDAVTGALGAKAIENSGRPLSAVAC